jgi:NAD(P)-dependent dehydrogenase (short-subunit alcohol dehydrogenase family)
MAAHAPRTAQPWRSATSSEARVKDNGIVKRLDGKITLITGAASGIGAAAARLFAAEGAQVVLADLQHEPLQALARETGGAASTQVADVSDDAAVRGLVDAALHRHGRIDVALLNAGIAGQAHAIEDYPVDLFDKVIAVNVRGVWLGLKYVMKAMAGRGGSIVITASTSGLRATPDMSAYTASKHAAIGLMRAAATEGAAKGIRVNSVNPATVDTPMVRQLKAKAVRAGAAPAGAPLAYSIPLGREGRADEVAHMMLFLASDEASFCTGGVYMVDGGATAGRVF